MNGKSILSIALFILLCVACWFLLKTENPDENFSKKVKVALREVGNDLLLSDEDSTSRVLPIKELSPTKYELSFENSLSFDPDDLVGSVRKSLAAYDLPDNYIVEVTQCTDEEVAYSFGLNNLKENENVIVACKGRELSLNCYVIQLNFILPVYTMAGWKVFILIGLFLGFILFQYFLWKKPKKLNKDAEVEDYSSFASFRFYPEQHKLVRQALEISLTRKESDILMLLLAKPNQTITRDELSKKVWEDNGVIVGRSLDTYISKLRKKLQADDTVQLTNVHGVGYKLEIKH